MTNSTDSFNKRRLRSSYLSVIVSMSLVLYMLGVLGMISINAKSVTTHFKENLNFSVYLNKDAKEVDIRKFHKKLDLSEFIKSTEYIGAKEAAEDLSEDLGEDFLDLLEENPLSDVISIHFKSEFTDPVNLDRIEKELLEASVVNRVVYDKVLVQQTNDKINTISKVLLGISVILCIIAVALINSSIRLAIYSKRFIIKTMQLVGATKSFIQRPFIKKSMLHGFYGALIALGFFYATFHYSQAYIPAQYHESYTMSFLILAGGIIITGLFISWICTYFAVRKYLKLKTDQLYY